MVTTRPPRDQRELSAIADLIEQVFADAATTRAHQAMVRAATFVPECLPAVWSAEGQPLSVVQAVPCKIALMGTWMDGGIITMVATDEEARGRGYMRACMNAAHDWLRMNGRPLAILYGVPAIYPRFDYRPVMPRSEVRYQLPAGVVSAGLRAAKDDDLAAITDLFNRQAIQRPCAVQRLAEPWIWQSAVNSIAVLEAECEVTGYVRYAFGDDPTLAIVEAASRPGWEPQLLDALHGLASSLGSERLQLRLMPDHPLVLEVNRRATGLALSGVELAVQPPQAGMLCVLDSGAVLEALEPEISRRLAGGSLRLTLGGDESLEFGAGGPEALMPHVADLAHLLSGYPGVPALRQWGLLQADDPAAAVAEHVFPTAWPRWVTAPFWGE